ncbi:MAG: hypothetical protein ABI091_16110 [Ferruginibacter sp.]
MDKSKEISEGFQKAKNDSEKIWKLVSEELKEPEPLLSYRGNPVIFKNSIVLIQGKTGVHKSRLTSSLTTLLISDDIEKSLLGFKNVSPHKNFVIYCDTERNISFQLPAVIKQIVTDSNLSIEQVKENFQILPLTNTNRSVRTRIMGKQFEEIKINKNKGKHIVVILDIVTDFIADFNSVGDTLSLTDLINQAINTYDVTFFIVIHENPNGNDKARGHLGTELSNKASTTFQMSESEIKDVFKVKMLKSRSTKKYDELLLKFDSTVNNLVVVNDPAIQLRAYNPEIFTLMKTIVDLSFDTINREELLKELITLLGWKERKIESYLKKVIIGQIEIETLKGKALLRKTRGKSTEYHMDYLELDDLESNNDQE